MNNSKTNKPTELLPKNTQQQFIEKLLNVPAHLEHCEKIEIHVHINGNNIVMGSDRLSINQGIGDIAIARTAKGGKQ